MLFRAATKNKIEDISNNSVKLYKTTSVETTVGYVKASELTTDDTLKIEDTATNSFIDIKIKAVTNDGDYVIIYI